MRIQSWLFSAALATAAFAMTPASAAPVGLAGMSGIETATGIEQVQYRRYYGRPGYRHYGYRRGYRGGGVAAGVAAGALGALAIGAIAAEASRPRPPVVNYEPACMRARSYDPASETFVDRRGRVRSCTY